LRQEELGLMKYLLIALLTLAVLASVAACGGKSKDQQINDTLNTALQEHGAGNLDAATADYKKVLALDPTNKYALYNLGEIDQVSGRADSAENNYRLSLTTDPNFGPALFNLAILRNNAGDLTEAEALYRHDILVDASNAGAHLNLGLLLESLGQTTEGTSEVEKAHSLNPALTVITATPAHPTAAPIATVHPTPSPTVTP
jgi:tetratricopeptide (TPR) repeat protein